MRIRDPKPEIQRLEELVRSVREGEIRLPKFQRAFVWNRQAMLDLWDSIYNGYPIGSILLWRSSERLKSERTIFGFQVTTELDDTYPTEYLLDGQQRLTTVCGALYAANTDAKSIWNINFDLEEEKFVYSSTQDPIRLFPLNRLLRTSDFIRQCMKFEHHPNARLFYRNAEKLLESVKNYKMAVVKIGDISLEEIAPVFERINSTGRKLTIVDLMRAATWKGGFDLSEAIETISVDSNNAGFGEIPDTLILRSISAAANLGIGKSDIDKLRNLDAGQLRGSAQNAHTAIIKATEFLRQTIGMPNSSFLPYGLQLTYLAEFFRLNKDFQKDRLDGLTPWFWRNAVTRHYSGSNTGQIAKELELIREFAIGNAVDLVEPQTIDVTAFLTDEFNLRTASSTTFSLLLVRRFNLEMNRMSNQIHFNSSLSRMNFRSIKSILEPKLNPGSANLLQVFVPNNETSINQMLDFDNESLYQYFLNREIVEAISAGDIKHAITRRASLICSEIANLTRCSVVRDFTLDGIETLGI